MIDFKKPVLFPVRKIAGLLSQHQHAHYTRSCSVKKRQMYKAALFLAAVTQFCTEAVLELAGNAAKLRASAVTLSSTSVSPRDIQIGIRSDDELNRLFGSLDSDSKILHRIIAALYDRRT